MTKSILEGGALKKMRDTNPKDYDKRTKEMRETVAKYKRSTSDGFMARTNKNSSGRKTDYVAMDKKEAEYRATRKQNKNKPIM
jgi:hypothetical protein